MDKLSSIIKGLQMESKVKQRYGVNTSGVETVMG
jgi:hypothetical protein